MKKIIFTLAALIVASSLFSCDDITGTESTVTGTTAAESSTESVTATAVTEAKDTFVSSGAHLWAASAGGKYGFINEIGEFVIEPKYADASPFSENGLAQVTIDTVLFGQAARFIDRSGEFAFVQPSLGGETYVYEFDESGLAIINVGDLYGFIDETGEIVIEPQFDEAYPFGESELALIGEKAGIKPYINEEGKLDVYPVYKYGYVNKSGEIIIEPQFDYAYYFSEAGLAIYGVQIGEETYIEEGEEVTYPLYKFGYIDETGNVVIEAQFDGADDFTESGLAPVMINGKYGYIDKTGNTVVEPQFDEAYPFDEFGFAIVGNHYFTDSSDTADVYGEYGYINTNGEVVIPLEYDDAYEFSDDGIALVGKDGEYFHIRTDGTRLYDTVFEDAYRFTEGLALVKADGKYGYIDGSGRTVIESRFDTAYPFSDNGYAIVGKYDGEKTLTGYDYEETYTYPVYKYGVIDRTGKLVVPMEFDDIQF